MPAYNLKARLCGAERQWGICRLLQSVFILSVLILASSVHATRLNDPVKRDDAALNGASDAVSDGADTSDEATEGADDANLTPSGEDLVSEVELKTIAPHSAGVALGSGEEQGDYGSRRDGQQRARQVREADKDRRRRQQYQEEQEKAEAKRKYDQVVEEMKGVSAAYQNKPKTSRIYNPEQTSQEAAYEETKKELGAVSPAQREGAMQRYRRQQQQRQQARSAYDKVLGELKEVLEKRKRRGAPGTGRR